MFVEGPRLPYAPLVGIEKELFCVVRTNRKDKKPYFTHFYGSEMQVRMCGVPSNEILKVKATVLPESDAAPYYGWYYTDKKIISMVWHARVLVEICFANGTSTLEDRGYGRVVALDVQVI